MHIDQYNGYIQIAHGGQHVVRGCIGQQLQNNQVNVCGTELIARCHGLLFGGNNAAVNDLNGIGNGLFESGILTLKFRNQGWELRQIGTQSNGKHANPFLLMLPVVFFNAETGKAQSES